MKRSPLVARLLLSFLAKLSFVRSLRPLNRGTLMNSKRTISVDAEPYVYEFEPAHCALVIIDMQRDFLEPGGFGEMLGNDVSQLRRTIEPNRRLMRAGGEEGLKVIHPREGHGSDMTDLPPAKKVRGRSKTSI